MIEIPYESRSVLGIYRVSLDINTGKTATLSAQFVRIVDVWEVLVYVIKESTWL